MIHTAQEIIINLPRRTVVDLLKDASHFKKWQSGLKSTTQLTPDAGVVGSRRRMKIALAGTTIIMTEEITKVDYPEYWSATYRSKGVVNKQENKFTSIQNEEGEATRWESTSTFKFTGFMRLIGKTQPQLFKRQTVDFMNSFKQFAETFVQNKTTKDRL